MRNQSPALRHRERMLAERTAGAAEPLGVTTGSAYELMLYKLADDRRRLKSIQSVERKIEVKATLLPDYAQWIDGVLAGGKGAQDDVFSTLLVWHIDTGEYERALVMAEYALAHKFTLPETYSRDIATLMLDEFSEGYLHGKLADDPKHAALVLGKVEQLTAASDAPDQARAKLHKAIGLAMVAVLDQADDTDIAPALVASAEQAMGYLKRARALSEACGVKKDMERLERRIKRAATSAEEHPPQHGGTGGFWPQHRQRCQPDEPRPPPLL